MNRWDLMPYAVSAMVCLMLATGAVVAQEQTGRIEGRIVRSDGGSVAGAAVVLNETGATAITGSDGAFSFSGIPLGTYSITMVLGEATAIVSNVAVSAGGTARVQETVDWEIHLEESLIVVATSRRLERIVESPSAVTRVSEAEIEARAAHGQLPKLLEFTPGAKVTQSGVYDYNFNTRGFNSSLNRRVATLVDGRNPSVPFLGAQEWAALTFPLDDLASLELLRGPSAALYGANASSGVLNMTTKAPRFSPGGLVRVAFGELDSVNLDLRWAGALGNEWYGKVIGGVRDSGDFTVSRRGAAEYSVPCAPGVSGDCLPQEAVPLARTNDNQIFFGGVRLDKYLQNGITLTMEGGLADLAGPAFQTGIGRVQLVDVQRPWARFNVNTERLNLLAAYTGRKAPEQLALASGSNLALDTSRLQLEGQTNWSFAGDRVQLVAGGSAAVENIDSLDERLGRQTLMFAPVDSNQQAIFGQVDLNLTEQLKLVLAGRGDYSSLHDAQFSPKASLVFSLVPEHSVRLTYNEAFQVPNYSEFFLQADVAAPTNLTALNGFCAPFGVDCGFGITRVLALGNERLELEQVQSWEIGYKGILGGRAFVTLDYYRSESSNFVTDLLPQLGTALGRVNPAFGPWTGPAGLPAPVVSGIRAAVPLLSNNVDGSNVLAAASYTNFGNVDTQGIDFGLNYYMTAGWTASAAYSWFDFEIQKVLPGFDTLLLPNSPEHAYSLGLGYVHRQLDAAVDLRWVDAFRWGVGPFQGDVESYTTVDLNANYALNDRVKVGLNVANLLDNNHWESFGGDLLGRRALANMQYGW